jgi:hypothetical protein
VLANSVSPPLRGDDLGAQHPGLHRHVLVERAVDVPLDRPPQVLRHRVLRVEADDRDLRDPLARPQAHLAELAAEGHLRLVVDLQPAEHEHAVLLECLAHRVRQFLVVQHPVDVNVESLRPHGGRQLVDLQRLRCRHVSLFVWSLEGPPAVFDVDRRPRHVVRVVACTEARDRADVLLWSRARLSPRAPARPRRSLAVQLVRGHDVAALRVKPGVLAAANRKRSAGLVGPSCGDRTIRGPRNDGPSRAGLSWLPRFAGAAGGMGGDLLPKFAGPRILPAASDCGCPHSRKSGTRGPWTVPTTRRVLLVATSGSEPIGRVCHPPAGRRKYPEATCCPFR